MAKATFYMLKEADRLSFTGKREEVMYKALISGYPDHQQVKVEVSKARESKTGPQLGYWYAVVMPFAVQAFRDNGYASLWTVTVCGCDVTRETDSDSVDLLFKKLYSTSIDKPFKGKSKMSEEEMSGLIDFALRWMAENLGAVCPAPENTL